MASPGEPTPETLANPLWRFFVATRPAFLSVTLVGCLLGLTSAHRSGLQIAWLSACIGTLFALISHAGVNVLNDYFDARNGADALNTHRVYPFTGGSRCIQNGVLSARATKIFALTLLGSVIPAGIWLSLQSGAGLLVIGLCGLLVGWSYSAPPLQLVNRGWGEIAIVSAWSLVVIGTDYVQRQRFDFAPLATSIAFALLAADILYINQFPDVEADALAGKRTLVVRLGPQRARWGYGMIACLSGFWIIYCVVSGRFPLAALASLCPLGLSAAAQHSLWSNAARPGKLKNAIKMTIVVALSHGAILCAVMLWG
jgi:1,4-dihydroxy-2-naphthoate octaprenyltransferase